MTSLEWRASISLASIFALRMLGLFLILPVFAVYAHGLPDGANATLVGAAMGIYGLTQGLLQLPFGMLSDRFGRKPVMIFGLVLFALGSFIAAGATDLHTIIIGRALQGSGAISAAITAMIADSTREQHRTKAMAMVGGSIALTFALSLIVAPVLFHVIGMAGLFGLTGVLAIGAIGVTLWIVPAAPTVIVARVPFREILANVELMRLNVGIFVLHAMQVAIFMAVPGMLVKIGHIDVDAHWQVYLPVVLASFGLMVPALIVAERRRALKTLLLGAVAGLFIVEILLWQIAHSLPAIVVCLLAWFVVFNILEATLPSLVSRLAPPGAKGSALGVYNTLQSLGLFVGGAVGGALVSHGGNDLLFEFGAGLVALWFIVALPMKNLPARAATPPADVAPVAP